MFCQVSTDGIQDASCTDITFTSANIPPRVADASLDGYQLARELSRHICERCGSEFQNESQLLHHVKMKHDGKQYACVQCNCSYVAKSGLNRHMKSFHKKLYKYVCETCGIGYMSRSRYYDHVAAHTGVKRHTCSMCEMKFMNKSTLKAHVIRFHPDEAANILCTSAAIL